MNPKAIKDKANSQNNGPNNIKCLMVTFKHLYLKKLSPVSAFFQQMSYEQCIS